MIIDLPAGYKKNKTICKMRWFYMYINVRVARYSATTSNSISVVLPFPKSIEAL